MECSHRNSTGEIQREGEHLHTNGEVQRKGPFFSMQMSSDPSVLLNTSKLVSIRLSFIDYKYSAVSNIPQSCYLKVFLLTIIITMP